MADLETRVAVLEREMAVIKDRTTRHEGELANIPELIKVEFRLANSRTGRLAADLAEFKVDVGQRFDKFETKVDTLIADLPKIVGDVVREVFDERDRRR